MCLWPYKWMIETRYIKVAVALPVPKLYTYEVPEKLSRKCDFGVRVLVPFGPRRVTGYVFDATDEIDGFTPRKIIRVLDDHPLFPASELVFFKWISGYYLFPVGEVIKAALPSGLDRHDVSCVVVTEKGRKDLAARELSEDETCVVNYIESRQTCSVKQLKKNLKNVRAGALLRVMEKEGRVAVTAVLKKDGPGLKMEKYLCVGKGEKQKIRMSKKRLKILELVGAKKELSLTGLKKDVPTAPSLIQPLAQAGWIEITERRVFRDPLGDPVEPDIPPELTDEQAQVLKQIRGSDTTKFKPNLLFGVTGSGKTEVYLRLVQDALNDQKAALVLVPEISLISQTERRFRARFGEKVAVIHSALTKGELLDQWRRIAMGRADIVIGARSAVFAPLEHIGVIIVDEEHDSSYKQETGLRYNARDLAVVRAKQQGCPVVLGSATPSVQTYRNVESKRFELLTLSKRVNACVLPDITLVDLKEFKDMRGTDRMISPLLAKEIRQCLDNRKQALIFLNRRGFATYPVCRDCGESLKCAYCDITMTLHRTTRVFRCHLCGHEKSEKTRCPSCNSNKIKPLGFGTQRVEALLKEMYPDARVSRMDQDTTSKKGALVKGLKDIQNRNVDIIVGTQMLAKGHDFPGITLVGIICADLSLSLPDFRAGERTFQLLAQVSGRAGRGDHKGRVVMQTYNPDHFIIESSKNQDFLQFYHNESPFRKALQYPPFTRMIQLKISGEKKKKTEGFAHMLRGLCSKYIDAMPEDKRTAIQILGPIEAPIQKISSRFRWQMLLKSPSAALINDLTGTVLSRPQVVSRTGINLAVDVDPYFLM